MKWSSETFTTLRDLNGLRKPWGELHSKALNRNPFVSFDWLCAWWSAFSQPDWIMSCVTVRRDEQLVAITPCYVAVENRLGRKVRVLRFWADTHSNRINHIISREGSEENCRHLVRFLTKNPRTPWDIGELGPVGLEDETTSIFVRALEAQAIRYGIDTGYSSPYFALPNDWERVMSGLSRSFRKSLQRKVNKATREGLTCALYSDCSRMSHVLDISADTWQHAQGTSLGSSGEIRRFYEGVSRAFDSAGALQIAILQLDGKAIAFELNLVEDEIVYNLKVGFRQEYSALSPGVVLRYHVLRHAVASGKTEFDFLGTDEKYKLHWTATTRLHGSVFIVRTGMYWRLYHLFRYRFKEALERHSPWVLTIKRRIQSALS